MEDNPRLYSDASQQSLLTWGRHLIHPGFRRHLQQFGHNESQGLCRHSIPGENHAEHTGVSRILSYCYYEAEVLKIDLILTGQSAIIPYAIQDASQELQQEEGWQP